ncbi:MAG: hypothetical protein ACM359_15205, partial [Bacillota bacterium]
VGFGVAQGIKTMMLMTQLKVLTLVLASVLATGGASWLALMQVAPKAAAQHPTTNPAAADQVLIDRTTPQKAIESLIRAMKASDRQKTCLCLGVDPNRPKTPMDAVVDLTLVENRLIRAGAKAFGGNGEQVRNALTIDGMAQMILASTLAVGNRPMINGDSATLVIDLPELAFPWLPEDFGLVFRLWQGKAIRFRKQDNQWIVDLDHTAHVEIVLFGQTSRENTPIKDPNAQVVLLTEFVRIIDQMTEDIEQGRLKSPKAAKDATWPRLQQVLDKQGPYVGLSCLVLPLDN